MGVKSIKKIIKQDLCAGCGTCVGICPTYAIKMNLNELKGVYIPEIDENLCRDCGNCYRVCPGDDVDFEELNLSIFGKNPENILLGNYLNCCIGHVNDSSIRFNSTSGGIITQLLISALDKGIIDGALLTRMNEDNPLEPEPFIARTKEEIIEASGSKYCPVPANEKLREILESSDGEKFAVVGTSCHIHGIRKAQNVYKNLNQKIVLTLGLFCGKCPNFTGLQFLLKIIGIEKDDVTKIHFRGRGWPGVFNILMKDGSEFLIPHSIAYSILSLFIPFRCTLCSDGSAELADISFADAWLPGLADESIGESIVIVRNETCEEIFESLTYDEMELKDISAEDIILQSHRSILNFKKKGFKSRKFIMGLFRRKTPIYNQKFLKPNITDYVDSITFYSKLYFASKRYLWKYLIFATKSFVWWKKGFKFEVEK